MFDTMPSLTCSICCAPCGDPDGQVNTTDLLAVIAAWGACDFDNDGMPDAWEIQNGLDPEANDADGDADGDGVSNIEEFQLGINPQSADTDGDGVNDGREINQGTNPNDPASFNPNPDDVIYVKVTIGDPGNNECGGIFSELWSMRIGSENFIASPSDFSGDPQTTNKTFACAPATGGGCGTGHKSVWTHTTGVAFKRGKSYPITVNHIGTCFTQSLPNKPHPQDYDYTANLTVVAPPGGGTIVPHILNDSQSLFGTHYDTSQSTPPWTNYAAGKTAWLHVPKFTLKSVTFGGSLHPITRDDNASMNPPHWLDANGDGDAADAGDNNYPIAMTRGNAVTVAEVRFKVEPPDYPADDLTVTGFQDVILFSDQNPTIQNGELIAANMSSFVPNTIACLEDFAIDWGVHSGAHVDSGYLTNTTIYVTLANPLQSPLYQTVVHRACKHANGQTTADAAIAGIWSYFATRVVQNHANQPANGFGYWRSQACATNPNCPIATSTPLLLTSYDGKCGAWGRFMRDVIKSHGISASNNQIIPDGNAPGLPPGAAGHALWVKHWDFSVTPFLATPIVAQGGTPVASAFSDHALVFINSLYYDPSYGRGPFATLAEWQRDALSGITFQNPNILSTNSGAGWPLLITTGVVEP